ncbi:hypothetical protein FACS1894159_06080 [Bacteroidia bacterium]|nr:hypothetical protein FACS1894159_06080 [Bacteroidia bacterium]
MSENVKRIPVAILISLMIATGCSGTKSHNSPKFVVPEPPEEEFGDVFSLPDNIEYRPKIDSTSMLRNPCTGWAIYADGDLGVGQAAYWAAQSEAARKYATHFYIRWTWNDMEPTEGQYAWKVNPNYKQMVQGALDRGLKLAFRVYNSSNDIDVKATPDYVRDAGAEGKIVNVGTSRPQLWTPYEDDPVFLEKLDKFVKAFALEYDNPDIVDYVDGLNVGSYGESHGITLKNDTPANRTALFDNVTTIYANNFHKVILDFPLASAFGKEVERTIGVEQKGYGCRRDGLGSGYFLWDQQQQAKQFYGSTPLFGEACWFGSGEATTFPSFWQGSGEYYFASWRESFEKTMEHAMNNNFNTLDLRNRADVVGWTKQAPDLVELFVKKGGYRIRPEVISAPTTARATHTIKIGHRWVNAGIGYLPNNNIRWNYKYKVALAILGADNSVKQLILDSRAEPSKFLRDGPYDYVTSVKLDDLPAGTYRLGVAIIDSTKGNAPAILLATKADKTATGWYVVSQIEITK